MITFAHPWLFLLLPLPWLVRRLMPPERTSPAAVRVPFGERLRAAGAGAGEGLVGSGGWSPLPVLPLLAWALVVVALARPQIIEPPVTKELPARDLLLLVDLSGSMQHEDFTDPGGKNVDRLTAVKGVLGDFLSRRDGDRVGLVVFGNAPFLQAPFSTDLDLVRQLLDETAVGMAGPRTAFGDAIGLGLTLCEESDAPAKTMVALTDGNDTDSQVPPVEAARVAAERGVRIHTVAIGDPATVGEEKLDEQGLRDVAKTTGGSYFFAADREQLSGIYDELDRIETREVDVVSHRPRRDLFYWPLLVALVLSIAEKLVAGLRSGRPPATGTAAAHGAVRVDPLTGKLELTP